MPTQRVRSSLTPPALHPGNHHDSHSRHPPRARLRPDHERRLPVQAPRRLRGPAGRLPPPAAHAAKALFSSKLFAIGMLIAAAAWIFHVAAMAVAPLSIVQAVLAGGVVLLAIMAERTFGLTISRRQWVGIILTAVGLLILGFSLPAVHGAHSRFSVPGMIGFEFGLLVVGTPADHRPADRRPGPAPRLHARRRLRHPLRRLRRRHQGDLGHGRQPRRDRPAHPLAAGHRSSPRWPPSTAPPRACRTATPCRSSPSRAPPPTSRASSAGSSCSAIRCPPTRPPWWPRCSPSRWSSWPPGSPRLRSAPPSPASLPALA